MGVHVLPGAVAVLPDARLAAACRDGFPIHHFLGKAGVVHHRARADAPGEARLGNRKGAACKGDVGRDPLSIDDDAQGLERLDHLDPAEHPGRKCLHRHSA